MKTLLWITLMASTGPLAASAPPFPAAALLSSATGVPLSGEAKAQLHDGLKTHPGCDFLYLPLLKERDAQAFQEYTARSGQDSLVLLYFLRELESYRPQLEAVHWGQMEILRRFLWTNRSAPNADACPAGIQPTRVILDGYIDEVTDECYSATLNYHFGDVPQTVSMSFCGPLEKEGGMQDLSALMQKYGIPLLHRTSTARRPAVVEKPAKPKPISK